MLAQAFHHDLVAFAPNLYIIYTEGIKFFGLAHVDSSIFKVNWGVKLNKLRKLKGLSRKIKILNFFIGVSVLRNFKTHLLGGKFPMYPNKGYSSDFIQRKV